MKAKFINCYGIKSLEIECIDFGKCNKAIIYASNGVCKTSILNTFEAISAGKSTCDRIFTKNKSSYLLDYNKKTYNSKELSINQEIFVIKSLPESFDISEEAISTLLMDRNTYEKYSVYYREFSNHLQEFQDKLISLSGIKKNDLKNKLCDVLEINGNSGWYDILLAIGKLSECATSEKIQHLKFAEIFNDKTDSLFEDEVFINELERYIGKLNDLVNNSEFLSSDFNETNVELLTKSINDNNLFCGGNSILLRNKEVIITLEDWNLLVKNELEKIYSDKQLALLHAKLIKNANTKSLKKLFEKSKEIIPHLQNISKFKIELINAYVKSMDNGIDFYLEKAEKFKHDTDEMFQQVSNNKSKWEVIVDEFNRRFDVPFKAKIVNKADVILNQEWPDIKFDYFSKKSDKTENKCQIEKEELLISLSTGERRAMYLLYILFDLHCIKENLSNDAKLRQLIVVDDIVDSFDYKNKYAIIECLLDISNSDRVDLLILSHSFDFYRNVASRLNIARDNCFIIQKDNEKLIMSKFKHLNDYFKKSLLEPIKNAKSLDEKILIKLIVSIPLYRNISEYCFNDDLHNDLTCYLHISESPKKTECLSMEDAFNVLSNSYIKCTNTKLKIPNILYLDFLYDMADKISISDADDSEFDNKIFLSIAIRMRLESHLKTFMVSRQISFNYGGKQTRIWSNLVKSSLNAETNIIIDRVNLMTPEMIHINSFMFEPIIDMSIGSLKSLYKEVKNLCDINNMQK